MLEQDLRVARRILRAARADLTPLFAQVAASFPSLGDRGGARLASLWEADMGDARWLDYAEKKDFNGDADLTHRVVQGVPTATQYVYVSYFVEILDVVVDMLRRAGAGLPELQVKHKLLLLDQDSTFRRTLRDDLRRWFLADVEEAPHFKDPKFVYTNWLRFPVVQQHLREGYKLRRFHVIGRSVDPGLITTSVAFEVLVDLTQERGRPTRMVRGLPPADRP